MKNKLPIAVILMTLFTDFAIAQPNFAEIKERFAKMENENLTKPFQGIATSKGTEKGLFSIQSTGVTTKPVKNAAEKFFNSLTKLQQAKIQFKINKVTRANVITVCPMCNGKGVLSSR